MGFEVGLQGLAAGVCAAVGGEDAAVGLRVVALVCFFASSFDAV